MKKARWHYVDGARSKGPYSLAELHHLQAQGRVTAQTLVWCEGMPGWQPLDTVGVGAPPTTAGFDTAPHDPYRAPGASAGPHPAASAADRLPGEMAPYAAFVDKRFPTYRKRWRLDFGGANAASTWHWPGFLFGVVWLMYRRMYGIAAVWYGVMIALTVLEKVAGLPEVVALFVFVGFSITAGACGNAWYLSHCQRNIAEVRRLRGYDEPRRLRVLAERGGTSVGSALAALGIALAMSVLGLLMAA